jgi:hypothetical protein
MDNRVEHGYTYKGVTYKPEFEMEDDNIKIFHYCHVNLQIPLELLNGAVQIGLKSKNVTMDWSPYSTPTKDEFNVWVDLDMPTRNGIGPLNSECLKQIMIEGPGIP